MAIAVTVLNTVRDENGATVYASVLFDNSYPTGGELMIADDFGLTGITTMVAGGVDDAKYHATFDSAAKALKLYVEDGTTGIEAEAGSASDQSAINVPVIVRGVV